MNCTKSLKYCYVLQSNDFVLGPSQECVSDYVCIMCKIERILSLAAHDLYVVCSLGMASAMLNAVRVESNVGGDWNIFLFSSTVSVFAEMLWDVPLPYLPYILSAQEKNVYVALVPLLLAIYKGNPPNVFSTITSIITVTGFVRFLFRIVSLGKNTRCSGNTIKWLAIFAIGISVCHVATWWPLFVRFIKLRKAGEPLINFHCGCDHHCVACCWFGCVSHMLCLGRPHLQTVDSSCGYCFSLETPYCNKP